MWQHLPEYIDPIALSIGPFKVHWYGVMYVLAFLTVYFLTSYRIRHEKSIYSEKLISDFLVFIAIGVLLGGRLGYVLFYDLEYFLSHPLNIVTPFTLEGGLQYIGIYGMSYHGGLIGVIISILVFCRKNKIDPWAFSDFVIPSMPLAYTFGRLGNFINSELYGRVTNVPWGMYFSTDPTESFRHPSQLYEAFFEGIFLFLVFWTLRNNKGMKGKIFPAYLIGYGMVRFIIEFFREPDLHIGFLFGYFSMGQILCGGMIIAGLAILLIRKNI
ncbi:MAG: prolipoprotein diacylglyceryl transferase [Candidatus Omnitrophota bacterium]